MNSIMAGKVLEGCEGIKATFRKSGHKVWHRGVYEMRSCIGHFFVWRRDPQSPLIHLVSSHLSEPGAYVHQCSEKELQVEYSNGQADFMLSPDIISKMKGSETQSRREMQENWSNRYDRCISLLDAQGL